MKAETSLDFFILQCHLEGKRTVIFEKHVLLKGIIDMCDTRT